MFESALAGNTERRERDAFVMNGTADPDALSEATGKTTSIESTHSRAGTSTPQPLAAQRGIATTSTVNTSTVNTSKGLTQ